MPLPFENIRDSIKVTFLSGLEFFRIITALLWNGLSRIPKMIENVDDHPKTSMFIAFIYKRAD